MKVIKTEKDYQQALEKMSTLFHAIPGSTEFEDAELLMALIEHYELKHYPMLPPDPIEVIKFRMEQLNLKRKDLEKYIGTRARVSEVLNGKRTLSLHMIKTLSKELGIPIGSLIC
jgi:HTH-type transcriptional regulator/antitoxin HigA